MVQVYYRNLAAIRKDPLALAPPDEGLEREGDYELVHEWPTAHAPCLEDIFDLMNRDSGSDITTVKGIRSMMPGDVVLDEVGDVWFCCARGWEETHW
jgi:hypothetical protein